MRSRNTSSNIYRADLTFSRSVGAFSSSAPVVIETLFSGVVVEKAGIPTLIRVSSGYEGSGSFLRGSLCFYL